MSTTDVSFHVNSGTACSLHRITAACCLLLKMMLQGENCWGNISERVGLQAPVGEVVPAGAKRVPA